MAVLQPTLGSPAHGLQFHAGCVARRGPVGAGTSIVPSHVVCMLCVCCVVHRKYFVCGDADTTSQAFDRPLTHPATHPPSHSPIHRPPIITTHPSQPASQAFDRTLSPAEACAIAANDLAVGFAFPGHAALYRFGAWGAEHPPTSRRCGRFRLYFWIIAQLFATPHAQCDMPYLASAHACMIGCRLGSACRWYARFTPLLTWA